MIPSTAALPLVVSTQLLGEIITWTCAGATVQYHDLITALTAVGLDTSVARELAPRHAFTRACRKLSDQRIIRPVAEDDATITFQFTAETRHSDRIDYELETMLTLDKKTGTVTCDLPGLATIAQEELDRCVAVRTGADLTRVIQKLFERHADLFSIRPQGGAYFCPAAHTAFVDQVQALLGRLNGQVLRFPVPAGTPEGDRSVKESVAAGLAALIAEHRSAIETFGTDTREETIHRAAEKIRTTRLKIEGYAELLADEKARLEAAVAAARVELRKKFERLSVVSSVA